MPSQALPPLDPPVELDLLKYFNTLTKIGICDNYDNNI